MLATPFALASGVGVARRLERVIRAFPRTLDDCFPGRDWKEQEVPPRVCRRPFGLSHAAMAGSSIMA